MMHVKWHSICLTVLRERFPIRKHDRTLFQLFLARWVLEKLALRLSSVMPSQERTIMFWCFNFVFAKTGIKKFEYSSDLHASVLVWTMQYSSDTPVKIRDVSEALHRDGYKKVVLHLDKVRLHAEAINSAVDACFKTMSSRAYTVTVIPVLSGMDCTPQSRCFTKSWKSCAYSIKNVGTGFR